MARRRRGHSALDIAFDDVGEAAEIVDEITWYMREHKVSRADLAYAMGVSPGRVCQILSGGEHLTLRTFASVVAALGARLELRPHASAG